MQENEKKIEESKVLTYEEALKAFKAQWADKRKAEKKASKQEELKAQREADKVIVKNAVEMLSAITPKSKSELDAVFTRLNMFLEDKRYTRNMKGE